MSFDRSASRLLVNGGPSPRPGVIETDRVTRTVLGSLRRTGKHKGPERALWAFRRAQPVRSIVTISATGEPATPRKSGAYMRDRVSGQVGRPLAPSVLGEIFQNAQKTLHSPRLQIILRQQHQTKLLGQNRQFPVGVFRRLARCFRIEISSLASNFYASARACSF